MAEIKRVTIPACVQHEGVYSIDVNIEWICPVCGGPRGTVYNTVSYDGSRRLHCHGWVNPCGHVDKYSAVRREALENGLNLPDESEARSVRETQVPGEPEDTIIDGLVLYRRQR